MVTALKNISEGSALEDYMDIDNLLRYMAVHVFFVNEDSLSGSMAHNDYLYESGGENRDTADTPQQTEEDTPNRGGNFEGRPSMDGFPRHIRKRIPGCIHRYAVLYGISLLVFAAALFFACLYRRRPKKR